MSIKRVEKGVGDVFRVGAVLRNTFFSSLLF